VNDFGVTEAKQHALAGRMQACGVSENDLEESFTRSGGPGGQHVNKTSTCVRLTHIPSGLTVKMQKARTQRLNRYYARKRLCELLENQRQGDQSPEAKRIAKIRKQKDRRRRRKKNQ
jgi:protein subunit release factor B